MPVPNKPKEVNDWNTIEFRRGGARLYFTSHSGKPPNDRSDFFNRRLKICKTTLGEKQS